MIRWKHEGEKCRARRCIATMRKHAVFVEGSIVGERNGPQGGWQCANGHCGYVWPDECEAIAAPRPAEQLTLWRT